MTSRILEEYLLPEKKRSRSCVGFRVLEEQRSGRKRTVLMRLHATKGWRKESASEWK